jgi:hypothetical protein
MKEANARTEIFTALDSLSKLVPEMRAAQLMAAIGEVCTDLHGRGLWDAEDDEFLEAIWQFRRGIEDAVAIDSPQNTESAATGSE